MDGFAQTHLPPRSDWQDLRIEPLGYPAPLNCVAVLLDYWTKAGREDAPCIRAGALR